MTTGPASQLPQLSQVRGLDVARGLRLFAGMADVYQEALQEFVQMYGPGLPGVNAYLEGPSPERLAQARRDVHGVGGASAALGATEIERLTQEFEVSLRKPTGPATDAATQLAALRDELATLVKGLRAHLEGT